MDARPLAALLLLPLLAGCLAGDDAPAGGDQESLAATLHAGNPALAWDPDAAIAWWEHIAREYPKHDAYLPTNALLRQHLIDELRLLGLDVEIKTYTAEVQGNPLPDTPYARLYAIVATKPGTELPDRRIGLVSHYDTEAGTIHGAYDDASGVAADFHLCKALAQVPMRRTLACIFFDGEEQGLSASRQYVEDVVLEGDEPYVYDYVLGYDMTGINWPTTYNGQPWKLYAMAGELWRTPGDADSADISPLYPFMQDLLHGVLGYPEEGVGVLDESLRNSDERRFKEAGVPIVRFAGGLEADDYDQYHMPLDTVEHVYEVAGGKAGFTAGFSAIVEASFATALALDETDLDAIAAAYGYDVG